MSTVDEFYAEIEKHLPNFSLLVRAEKAEKGSGNGYPGTMPKRDLLSLQILSVKIRVNLWISLLNVLSPSLQENSQNTGPQIHTDFHR